MSHRKEFKFIQLLQLIEVFTAYGNQFAKTVEFFKENLQSEIDAQIQAKGQELATQVRVEAQAV